jgi:hypothetical protein
MPQRSDVGTPASTVSTIDIPSIPPPAELNLCFESGTLAGWKAEGDAVAAPVAE